MTECPNSDFIRRLYWIEFRNGICGKLSGLSASKKNVRTGFIGQFSGKKFLIIGSSVGSISNYYLIWVIYECNEN